MVLELKTVKFALLLNCCRLLLRTLNTVVTLDFLGLDRLGWVLASSHEKRGFPVPSEQLLSEVPRCSFHSSLVKVTTFGFYDPQRCLSLCASGYQQACSLSGSLGCFS